MPDTPDFDAARRALGDVPAPDLWPEAERRAAAGVVSLDPDAGRARRPTRWLAAAAVAVLAVGTVAVLTDDDGDRDLDTGPSQERTIVPLVPPTIEFPAEDGRCGFALGGPGPYEPIEVTEDVGEGQPANQRRIALSLGDQEANLAVPGVTAIDLVGERVEEVELQRGTAQLWFGGGFVQVRWFPGGQDPCGSFTVTVAGSTEDGNRHAAVELADQVLLPADLEAALLRTHAGEWELQEARVDDEVIDGEGLRFTFNDAEAGWNDGCNLQGGVLEVVAATVIGFPEIERTSVSCPPSDRLSEAIGVVMRSPHIVVSTSDGTLSLATTLGGGSTGELRLRPVGGEPSESDDISLAGTTWEVVGLTRDGEAVAVPSFGPADARVTFTFSAAEMDWGDGCNFLSSAVEYTRAGLALIGDQLTTRVGCQEHPGRDLMHEVMGSDSIEASYDGDLLVLASRGGTLILRRSDASDPAPDPRESNGVPAALPIRCPCDPMWVPVRSW